MTGEAPRRGPGSDAGAVKKGDPAPPASEQAAAAEQAEGIGTNDAAARTAAKQKAMDEAKAKRSQGPGLVTHTADLESKGARSLAAEKAARRAKEK